MRQLNYSEGQLNIQQIESSEAPSTQNRGLKWKRYKEQILALERKLLRFQLTSPPLPGLEAVEFKDKQLRSFHQLHFASGWQVFESEGDLEKHFSGIEDKVLAMMGQKTFSRSVRQ